MLSDFHLSRLVAQYSRDNDTASLKSLAAMDHRVAQCEVCDEWFVKESPEDEDICPSCEAKGFEEDSDAYESQLFLCKWCGIKFHRTKDWASARFCCPDCRDKATGLEKREQSRQERKNLGII